MPYTKLELKVRRIERELKKAQTNLLVAQAELRDTREIRDRLWNRLYHAKSELKEEREPIEECE